MTRSYEDDSLYEAFLRRGGNGFCGNERTSVAHKSMTQFGTSLWPALGRFFREEQTRRVAFFPWSQ